VHVHVYNEDEIDPPALDSDAYFHRFNVVNILKRDRPVHLFVCYFTPDIFQNQLLMTTSYGQPFPLSYTCKCNLVYDPFPPHMEVAELALEKYLEQPSKERNKPGRRVRSVTVAISNTS
jgi:hypothetical protein